ncbi:MAG: hypothetical protein ACRCXC_07090 [Legionella sp.]
MVFGAAPGSFPTSVTGIDSSSSTFTVKSTSGVNFNAGQFAAISDCVNSSVFLVTAVTGTTMTHSAGTGEYGNATSDFILGYQAGAQFIPMQQTAFLSAKDKDGKAI